VTAADQPVGPAAPDPEPAPQGGAPVGWPEPVRTGGGEVGWPGELAG
jgi:hypothetical protein